MQLDLSWNSIGGHEEPDGYDSDGDEQTKFVANLTGIQAIADALKVTPSLTSLLLGDNYLGDKGVEALSVGLKESKSLATLDLSNKNGYSTKFGPAGAAALASAIAVMASLTHLDVQFNSLGEEGEAVLRKAVEGRSGLELKL